MQLSAAERAELKSAIVAELISQLSLHPQVFEILENPPWVTDAVPHASQSAEESEAVDQLRMRVQNIERAMQGFEEWRAQCERKIGETAISVVNAVQPPSLVGPSVDSTPVPQDTSNANKVSSTAVGLGSGSSSSGATGTGTGDSHHLGQGLARSIDTDAQAVLGQEELTRRMEDVRLMRATRGRRLGARGGMCQ